MYRIFALAVLVIALAFGSAIGSPVIGGGVSVGGSGKINWSLTSLELYSDWDGNAIITGRMGICYLPPLFPQEPPALYLGLGMRLAFGGVIRGVIFGSAGSLIEDMGFQGSKASIAARAGIGLEIAVSKGIGFYLSSSFVVARKAEKVNQQGSPFKLFFPWAIGIIWSL